jgi:heme-degrading monooxygenase HmoA
MYVRIWEYDVPPAAADRFVAAYAAGGEWAQLFARADGFLGTELFRSAERLPPGELCVRGRGGSSR